MFYVVDRIESEKAICYEIVSNESIVVDIKNIDGALREGCVLSEKDNRFFVDEDMTQRRKNKIESLTRDIWN